MNDRFYCPNCMNFIHDGKVKTRRIFPHTRAPWPLFEYVEVPVCPVCDSENGDLIDTLFEKIDPPDYGNPPYFTPNTLRNIIGSMPDLPDGFPREDNKEGISDEGKT